MTLSLPPYGNLHLALQRKLRNHSLRQHSSRYIRDFVAIGSGIADSDFQVFWLILGAERCSNRRITKQLSQESGVELDQGAPLASYLRYRDDCNLRRAYSGDITDSTR